MYVNYISGTEVLDQECPGSLSTDLSKTALLCSSSFFCASVVFLCGVCNFLISSSSLYLLVPWEGCAL